MISGCLPISRPAEGMDKTFFSFYFLVAPVKMYKKVIKKYFGFQNLVLCIWFQSMQWIDHKRLLQCTSKEGIWLQEKTNFMQAVIKKWYFGNFLERSRKAMYCWYRPQKVITPFQSFFLFWIPTRGGWSRKWQFSFTLRSENVLSWVGGWVGGWVVQKSLKTPLRNIKMAPKCVFFQVKKF